MDGWDRVELVAVVLWVLAITCIVLGLYLGWRRS